MTRSAACEWSTNSGSQSRSSQCNINDNSGTQSRAVVCMRNDGVIVADSYCTTTKPNTILACTPTSDSACGNALTSQSCTPSSSPSCSGATEITSSCNTQDCTQPPKQYVCTGPWIPPTVFSWDRTGEYLYGCNFGECTDYLTWSCTEL